MIARALVGALLVVLVWAGSAIAATGSLVGVHPLAQHESWIVLRLDPGQTARPAAVLVNLTDRPQTVDLGTADGVTTADGVFTLAGAAERPVGVGAWIDLPDGRVTLAPGERRVIRLRVRVPADAAPGDHSGGVVVQSGSAARAPGGEGVAVRVVERVGLRVYVTVEGERDATIAVDGLDAHVIPGTGVGDAMGLAGGVDVSFTARHAGNVRFDRLLGAVELRRGDAVTATREVDLGTVLPGAARPVSVRLPLPRWSPGGYEVSVRLADAPGPQAAREVSVSPVRPLATAGLLLAVAGAGLWGSRGGRSRRAS